MLDELKEELNETNTKFDHIGGIFDPDKIKKDISGLEKETTLEGFYNDQKRAQSIFDEITRKRYWITSVEKASILKKDIKDLFEMLTEDEISSKDVITEIKTTFAEYKNIVEELELKGMLSAPEDQKNCLFTIHAGSGGTEASDWANMLLRMYTRFFDRMDFKWQEVDLIPGDTVGIKSVTIEVKGEFPYGFLKSESGVHRLIRISPFDAASKRHTSFASVYVLPEADDIEITIDPSDLRVDTYRSSGAGGQHVNKTDSAVRITHIPTGLVAQSQNQRSQAFNKETAMKMLKAKLYQQKLEEEKAKMDTLEGEKKEISWGSQIRTYTFQPYNLVKDHRTGLETGNTGAVMDGELIRFVRGYLIKFGKFE
ncbi:MAG: peptide chain release factor 2 [Candidatus Delongbacteria bacterium]